MSGNVLDEPSPQVKPGITKVAFEVGPQLLDGYVHENELAWNAHEAGTVIMDMKRQPDRSEKCQIVRAKSQLPGAALS